MRVFDCVPEQGKYCIKVQITIRNIKKEDLGLWYVSFDQVSVATTRPFRGAEVRAGDSSTASQSPSSSPYKPDVVIQSQGPVRIVQTKDLKELIEVETGFGDSNLWLEWIQYTARSVAKE